MKYRKLGNIDYEASALGFGCMRLPTVENNATSGNIIQKDVDYMVDYAIENGVNYFDTAYFYHSQSSEAALGKALKGKRDKVIIADKLPMMIVTQAKQFNQLLEEQLSRLGVDYIDNYLFHSLNRTTWKIAVDEELLPLAENAKKAGKIKHIGFSFHDSYEIFEQIVNDYSGWEFCQIQYNFMDTDYQAGEKGLLLAHSKNIGVVVMEPLRGGKFASPIKDAQIILEKHNVTRPLKEIALKWVWKQPQVGTVLSGMSDFNQLKENIEFANQDYSLAQNEQDALSEIKRLYLERRAVPCTACQYCMPCPQGINIPAQLHLYNEGIAFDYYAESKRMYAALGKQAQKCVACGACEPKCPQSIHISEMMPQVHEKLN